MTQYTCVTRVTKTTLGSSVYWKVSVEIDSVCGHGDSSSLPYAFGEAHEDAMAKLAEAVTKTADGTARDG